jgi:hypothetical protein
LRNLRLRIQKRGDGAEEQRRPPSAEEPAVGRGAEEQRSRGCREELIIDN